jgi:hypothetical protein
VFDYLSSQSQQGQQGQLNTFKIQRPWYLDYIADRDLWNHKLPFTKPINNGLFTQSMILGQELFFKQLEAIHTSEAKILIAVKDQNLDSIYPKITAEFVKANFPDVLPEGSVVAEPAKKAKAKSATKMG